jgi:hypothetical protein
LLLLLPAAVAGLLLLLPICCSMGLATRAVASGVATPVMRPHARAESDVVPALVANSDGDSCPDLRLGLGGDMDDTSSEMHRAGELGSAWGGVGGAGVGLLSLMQRFTHSVQAKVHDAFTHVLDVCLCIL